MGCSDSLAQDELMKLTKIDITNFRCFESLAVPLQPDVNVFVGVNASGKTAVLDAIAIALYDIVAANGGGGKRQRALQSVNLRPSDIHIPLDAREPVTERREFVQISAQAGSYYALREFPSQTPSGEQAFIEWTNHIRYRPPNDFDYETSKSTQLSDLYRYFQGLWQEIRRSDPKALIPIPVVAYYRAHRRLFQMPQMGDIFQSKLERQDAFQNALDAGAHYQAMCQWFYLRENRELRERLQIRNDGTFEFPDLRAVRQALCKTLEHVERVFFDDSPPRLKVAFAALNGSPQVLELEQLSDGYRNLLAVVLDFARRLAQAHPNWEKPLEAPGVLLIDEIELHLHPQWQQKIIPNLCAVFPNTQLIMATHSPQVLTTVESRSIFILRDRELRAAPLQTYGAENKRVMQEVMQTDSRPPDNENVNQIRELFRLINQGHLQQASVLCKELMHRLGQDEPTLIEAQTIIENRAWEQELGL
jgi:predicted ATP-binding protein involved in virulence